MKKKLSMLFLFTVMLLSMCFVSQAASYSSAWYLSNNTWYIKGPNGQAIKGAWVCDNAAGPGSSDNWYLLDTNGQMVTSPLVVDGSGNYYSLETSHNGNYGMLRHTNGTYDGIYLSFNQNHNGSFGAITNQDGINALKNRYGVYSVAHISSYNCYYTASYTGTVTTTYSNTSSRTYTLNFYVNGTRWKSTSSSSDEIYVRDYGSSLKYWEDRYDGSRYYPGDYYYFDSGRVTASLDAVFSSSSSVNWDVYESTYELYYYVGSECVLYDASKSSPMLIRDIGYASLEKYVDSNGNPCYPEQYYHFDNGSTVGILYAVLGSSTYAEDDYGDDCWY